MLPDISFAPMSDLDYWDIMYRQLGTLPGEVTNIYDSVTGQMKIQATVVEPSASTFPWLMVLIAGAAFMLFGKKKKA